MDPQEKRLLLVEDEAILALQERWQLEKLGYSVDHALSGEAAVARIAADGQAFDAVLMDIDLGPGMDGTQAAETILRTADVPIVFLSSHTEPDIVTRTERITCYGYVVKNSGIVVLDASIKMALKLFEEKAERGRAERQVLQLKSLYAALSQINQAIVRIGAVEELAAEVSRVAVKFGLLKFAWVGRHDSDTREIIPLGFAGEPESIVSGIRHSSDEAAARPCLCGPAVREDRPNVRNDLAADAENSGLKLDMERAGIKAAAVFPVRARGAVWGVFGVYAGEAGIFGEEEIALLEEAAMDIGYAVENIENEARRRRAEELQLLSTAVLGILNEPLSLHETSRAILKLIKEKVGLDAVGIRLRDRDDYPYFSEEGFAEDFLNAENSLITGDEAGAVCRDADGRICLECTCGMVIEGRCGPPSDNVTPAGSLWTNDSRAAVEAMHGGDPRLRPRDRCVHDGFLSVALIPIRADGEIIGLLHLNDRRKDRFTPESIRFFEGLTASFGIAVGRKRDEERLRLSEERFRLALAHAPVSVAVQDLDMRFTWAYNQRTRRTDEIIGKTDYDLFPLEAESLVAMKRRAIETGQDVCEKLWITSNGRRLFLELHIEPLRDAGGKIDSLGLVTVDLTEIKQAEDRLQGSEAIFKAVFDNAPVGISIIDSDRRVLESNGMLERILRIGKEDLAGGAHLKRRYVREDGTEFPMAEFASSRAIAEGAAVRDVVSGIVLEDGAVVWMQASAAPLGRPDTRLVVIVQDITERKLAEEELQRQLAEKEIMLKEVHHRIKNNISSIEGLLSIQADSSRSYDVKSALQESIARVQSSRILYEKLMTSDDYGIVSTKGYVESLVDSLIAVFPGLRGVAIELEVEDFTMSSKAMISIGIIINELMTNIFKHAFEGRSDGRVRIELARAGGAVRLTIKDNGVGIPERPEAQRSAGFGLTIVRMLTEQLKGSFAMTRDDGTKSVVEFPMPKGKAGVSIPV